MQVNILKRKQFATPDPSRLVNQQQIQNKSVGKLHVSKFEQNIVKKQPQNSAIDEVIKSLKQLQKTKETLQKENLLDQLELKSYKNLRDQKKIERKSKMEESKKYIVNDRFELVYQDDNVSFQSFETNASQIEKVEQSGIESSQQEFVNQNNLSDLVLKLQAENLQLKEQNEEFQKITSKFEENSQDQSRQENLCELQNKYDLLLQYMQEKDLKIQTFQKDLYEQNDYIQAMKQELILSNDLRAIFHKQIQEMRGNIRIFCRIKPSLSNQTIRLPELTQKNILSQNQSQKSSLNNTLDNDITEQQQMKNLKDYILNENDKVTIELQKHFVVQQNNNNKLTVLELIANKTEKQNYFFDSIFDMNAKQSQVFEEISPIVQSAIDGENCCILAYGQTGSGKTFTMEGEEFNEGILPRSLNLIINQIDKLKQNENQFNTKILFGAVEIYNEKITDLLEQKNEVTLTTQGNNVKISNMHFNDIDSIQTIQQNLKKASNARTIEKTSFNERSSRSHSIYIIKIITHHNQGQLYIVDLAGSERSQITNNPGLNKKEIEKQKKIQLEANFINQSLSTLGRIIRMRSEHVNPSQIPYRESKLTRILKDCLSEQGKCVLIVNVCPESQNYYQTKESLKFATKASS